MEVSGDKELKIRQNKLTRSARNEPCLTRIPQVCNHNPETTVLAHLGGEFKHGYKAMDIHGAYCCSSCHDAIDGRSRTDYSKDQLKQMHLEGVIRTQLRMVELGLIEQ